MPQSEWTILKLIRWTDERFDKSGIPTPRLDAEILLSEALGMDRVGLYTHFDQPLQPDELARFKQLIQRRLKREPLAYITGRREFWSLDLSVSPAVLIPRPETELLVEEGVRLLRGRTPPQEKFLILEIGTGSGAISVALARELPESSLVATDVSPEALAVAEGNAGKFQLRERIEFRRGDLFSPIKNSEAFDLIVTNPPYISWKDFPLLQPEIGFEPRAALDGGEDGLDFYRRALPQIHTYLVPEGWFFTEIGAGQDEAILRIAQQNRELDSFDFIRDLAGTKRVFKARKKC